MNSLILRSGAKMPSIGFGTFVGGKNSADAYKATICALESGYRHIDTAQFYGTEKHVGKAIKDSGIPREEIFVNSKIYNTCYNPNLVPLQLEQSLEALQMDYLDSWLMHTPWAFVPEFDDKPSSRFAKGEDKLPFENEKYDMLVTWNTICDQVKKGYVRDPGVSNFSVRQVDYLIREGKLKPSVNQVECHPYLNNEALIQHHQARGVMVTGYAPLGGPGETTVADGYTLLENPTVIAIGEKYGKSAGQILIKFQVQRKIAVIPKSVTPSRIASNMDVFDFELESEDMDKLMALNGPHRAYNFPRAVNTKHYPF